MKDLEERYIEERHRLIEEEGFSPHDATKEAYRKVFSEVRPDR